MKRILMISAALYLSLAGIGQETTGKSTSAGKIIYEDKMKLDIKLEGDAAQFASSLPKEQVNTKALIFNSDYSLYTEDAAKTEENPSVAQSGHMTVRMIVSGGNDKTFTDLKSKKKIEQKEFMTRMFLIESEIETQDWKITGNSINVLGYNCLEAIREKDGKKVSVWFSTMIPVSSGPAEYGGLPGMILMVDIDSGKRIITARKIDPGFTDASKIVRPDEGKKVTSEEFKKIVDEKMKEMGSESGDGESQIVIKIKG